jgi:rod shape-determining protein MreC
VPRERSVRLAGLSSPAKRGAHPRYRARVSRAARRRLVAGVLVLASLAMITAYFRESDSGAMHDVQGAASSILEPFQIGADRLVAPFRDAWGYASDLIGAKSENADLRRELRRARSQSIQAVATAQELENLQALLAYRRSLRVEDFRTIGAEVLVEPPTPYRQTIVIAAGANDGVRRDYPVVATGGLAGGLAGHVTKVFSDTAQVTLLTDSSSFVSAFDPSTGAYGLIRGRGEGKPLVFDRVLKSKSVSRGHPVATSGRRFRSLGSLYPRNIEIGVVSSVTHLSTELFKSIQVVPYVDFSSLQSVLVLIPKNAVSELPPDDAG